MVWKKKVAISWEGQVWKYHHTQQKGDVVGGGGEKSSYTPSQNDQSLAVQI